jgi:hypothetical protein
MQGHQQAQAAQTLRQVGPVLGSPDRDAAEDLEGQQQVQDHQVGHLLQGVELLARGLLEGMGLAPEDAPGVIQHLADRLVEEAPGRGQVLAHIPAGHMVEQAEGRVGQQHEPQDVVQLHGGLETAEGEQPGGVYGQSGDDQSRDRQGLQPVPEALVAAVHVYPLRGPGVGSGQAAGQAPAQGAVQGDHPDHQHKGSQAQPVDPAQAVMPQQPHLTAVRGQAQHAVPGLQLSGQGLVPGAGGVPAGHDSGGPGGGQGEGGGQPGVPGMTAVAIPGGVTQAGGAVMHGHGVKSGPLSARVPDARPAAGVPSMHGPAPPARCSFRQHALSVLPLSVPVAVQQGQHGP